MNWREFLRTYVPLLIGGIFVVGFIVNAQGWSYLSNSPLSLIPYLSAIAVVFTVVSFGIGSVAWSVLYVFKSSRPSYLSSVKNTLILLLGISLLGVFSEFSFLRSESGKSNSANETQKSSQKDEKNEIFRGKGGQPTTDEDGENETQKSSRKEEYGEIARGEDGEPITIEDFKVKKETIVTWRETALWKTRNREEVIMWVESGEELRLKETGNLFEVVYKGSVGYVDKENIKPEDR